MDGGARRGTLWGLGLCALLLGVALTMGCEQSGGEFAQTLHREWTVAGPDGQQERVLFEGERILWRHGTEKQYSCPYRIMSFSEKTRTININLWCKKRTGTNDSVSYLMKLSEDLGSMEVVLEGRTIDVFRAAPSRG